MDHIQHSSLDDHLNDSLELNYESCFFCNGYYGPCFGEPLCGTCHDFMYAEQDGGEPSGVRSNRSLPLHAEDDGDSGNDEPNEDAVPGAPVPIPNPGAAFFNGQLNGEAEEPDEEPEWPAPAAFPIQLVDPVPIIPNQVGDENANALPAGANVGGNDNAGAVGAWVLLRSPPPNMDRINSRLQMLTTPRASHEMTASEDTSLRLPPEIWSIIFRLLEPSHLMMASKVNKRWRSMIQDQYGAGYWEGFIRSKFPIFHPIYAVTDWYSICSDFIDSLPCKTCFLNMGFRPNINTAIRSLRSVRLSKEIKWLRADHFIEGIEAIPLDDLNYNWLARINGPRDSPYQGGVFYLNIKVSHEYPLYPPILRFLTKIFHPNISRHGDIGIDCIQHNWTLALTIPQTLLSVQSLLTDPCTEENMEPGVAELYKKDKNTFDRIARIWTWKYAMHDVLIH